MRRASERDARIRTWKNANQLISAGFAISASSPRMSGRICMIRLQPLSNTDANISASTSACHAISSSAVAHACATAQTVLSSVGIGGMRPTRNGCARIADVHSATRDGTSAPSCPIVAAGTSACSHGASRTSGSAAVRDAVATNDVAAAVHELLSVVATAGVAVDEAISRHLVTIRSTAWRSGSWLDRRTLSSAFRNRPTCVRWSSVRVIGTRYRRASALPSAASF